MPRYYFNIRTAGLLEEDQEGAEFANIKDAKDEAIQAAREIMAEKILTGDLIDGQRFEITAEDGTVLGEVSFRSALRLD